MALGNAITFGFQLKRILASAVVMFGSVQVTAAAELTVLNWSDYIDPGVMEDFTKQTGIKIIYDTLDSDEMLETKMLIGGSGYDLVFPTAKFVTRQIQATAYQPIDKSKIPNLRELSSTLSKSIDRYDAGATYTVPYLWATIGIGYDVDKIKARNPSANLTSSALFFDPEVLKSFADCGVVMLDAPEEVYPTVLNYLGLDPNSKTKADLESATAHLIKLKPYITKIDTSSLLLGLADGTYCMALGYSGDVMQASAAFAEAKGKTSINYLVPEEGAEVGFTLMAIPKDAPNPDAAHQFMNFVLEPANAARVTQFTYYPNPVPASNKLLEKDILENPAIYPPEALMTKLFTTDAANGDAVRLTTRLWTTFKTGQ